MIQSLRRMALLLLLGASAACTPMNRPAQDPPSASVPADKARVYVAFPQSFPFGEAHVVQGEKLIGYVRNGQHIIFDIEPGKHTLMLIGENEEAVQGTFLPGKEYHMRVFLTPGAFGSRTYWTPLENTEEGIQARKKDLAESTLVELNPQKAKSWEKNNGEEMLEYEQEFASGDEEAVTLGEQHAL